jgi:hypothetical protein
MVRLGGSAKLIIFDMFNNQTTLIMKYLLLLLCFYCTVQAQPHCEITPEDVIGTWQLVTTVTGAAGKSTEHANSTEFVTFTATTFTHTKDGKAIKSGAYVFDESYWGCLLKLDGTIYKGVTINTPGTIILFEHADDIELRFYNKVE